MKISSNFSLVLAPKVNQKQEVNNLTSPIKENERDSFVSQNGQILSQEKLVVVLEDEAGRTVDENYFRNEYIENQKRNLQNGFITQEEFDSMMANIDVYANIIK